MEDVVRPKTLEERLCAIEKRAWRVPKGPWGREWFDDVENLRDAILDLVNEVRALNETVNDLRRSIKNSAFIDK